MKNKSKNTNFELNLGWLYPTLMSTYGDRGNILVLQKIAKDNNINLKVIRIEQSQNSQFSTLNSLDLIFMGGGEDLQQEIVAKDLISKKGEILKQKIEDNIPGLFICGAYQFLGKYYKDANGKKMEGLKVLDCYTESYNNEPRLTGNIVIKTELPLLNSQLLTPFLIGFENHGGRTFLTNPKEAFAKVIIGYGNNGYDNTEGIVFKNTIGTYLHGPILPSNPELGGYLLEKAIEQKYKAKVKLATANEFSQKAKMVMLKRLKADY